MIGFLDLITTQESDLTPDLRAVRDRYEAELIDAHAKTMNAAAQRKAAAKAPRSSRRSPTRRKILDVMAQAHRAHDFDTFLAQWLAQPYDNLAISKIGRGPRYLVEDTEAGGEGRYTRNTLLKLWSQSDGPIYHR